MTFAAPLYLRWAQEYHDKTGVRVNHYAIGSTGGIRQITARAFDFGASDAPMTDQELRAAPGILHIPTVAGAVVVAYHVPGVGPGIHLTSEVIANIFLGKITNWNDPRITSFSPGTKFPDLPIVTVHRSDGSGTTNVFTTYLSQISPTWKREQGAGKSVHWRIGLAGKGNQGVSDILQDQAGGIDYVELAFAVHNVLPYASVCNLKGQFIYSNLTSTAAAVAGAMLPSDFRMTVTNTSARNGYQISGTTMKKLDPNDLKPCPHMRTLVSAWIDERLTGLARWYTERHIQGCRQCQFSLPFLRGMRAPAASRRSAPGCCAGAGALGTG